MKKPTKTELWSGLIVLLVFGVVFWIIMSENKAWRSFIYPSPKNLQLHDNDSTILDVNTVVSLSKSKDTSSNCYTPAWLNVGVAPRRGGNVRYLNLLYECTDAEVRSGVCNYKVRDEDYNRIKKLMRFKIK